MKTSYKTRIIYDIVNDYYEFNEFEKSFFELTDSEIRLFANLANLFNIKPRYGVSKARTLFYRLAEYKQKIESGE